jgi:hypothetical protein
MKALLVNLAPLLINAAERILDELVEGEKLTKDVVKGLKIGYVAGKLYLQEIVDNTETDLDNDGLESFFTIVEDTLKEAGEAVPVV